MNEIKILGALAIATLYLLFEFRHIFHVDIEYTSEIGKYFDARDGESLEDYY